MKSKDFSQPPLNQNRDMLGSLERDTGGILEADHPNLRPHPSDAQYKFSDSLEKQRKEYKEFDNLMNGLGSLSEFKSPEHLH